MFHPKLALLLAVVGLAITLVSARYHESQRYDIPRQMQQSGYGRNTEFPSSSSSSSSNSHRFGSGRHSFTDPTEVATQLNVSQEVGVRLIGMAMVVMSLDTPKSVSRLLFNGNESVEIKDELQDLFKHPPRTTGNDEYACVNRCANQTRPPTTRAYDDMTNVCSAMQALDSCVQSCAKSGGVLVPFVRKELAQVKPLFCSEHNSRDLQKLVQREGESCMKAFIENPVDLLKLFHHVIGCHLELEETRDNKDTCYSIKHCAIESTVQKLEQMCPNSKTIIGFLKPGMLSGMTYLSDGRLVEECPSLFVD